MPEISKNIVKSIGLGKRGSVVYRRATPAIAGSIARVKELVSVELSEHMVTKEQERESRKSNPGFIVEKRVFV